MAYQSRQTFKDYTTFNTGGAPTEQNFEDFFDSIMWQSDDDFQGIQSMRALGSTIRGQSVNFGLHNINQASAMTDGVLEITGVRVPEPCVLAGASYWQNTAGVYTADNFNGAALYTYDGAGTLTRQIMSLDRPNQWKSALSTYQKIPFDGTYTMTQRGLVFIAILYNTSAQTTAPAMGSFTVTHQGLTTADHTNSAKMYGTLNAQTGFPSTIAMSSISATNIRRWIGVYD